MGKKRRRSCRPAGYDECIVIRYYTAGGSEFQVAMPGELDLAIQHATLDEQESAIERIESEKPPANVSLAKNLLASLDASDPDRDVHVKVVADYEAGKSNRLSAWMDARTQTIAKIERMERQIDVPDEFGGEEGEVVFRMREFGYAERIECDERNSTIEDVAGVKAKQVDTAVRNLELLQACILGEYDDDNNVHGVVVGEMQSHLATIMIDRMWARNMMNPALAGFFGKRRKV